MDYRELLATPNQFVKMFPFILKVTKYGNNFNPISPFMAMKCHTNNTNNAAFF